MLNKMLMECSSVSDEEDVIEHMRTVLGLLSRMGAPRYDKKNETVDEWIQKCVPKYVRNADPGASDNVSNKQRCQTIKNALNASMTLDDLAAELEITVACGMFAGMMHAKWMMEGNMHTTQLRNIYPDEMDDALDYLKYFSEYSTMFDRMTADGKSIPDLLSAVQGDSNLIHAVEAFLYGRGICGADGKTTISPWSRLVPWLVDLEGDLKDTFAKPNSFKSWSKRTAAAVVTNSDLRYCAYNDDREKGKAAAQWVVKTFTAKSPELESLKFMAGQGVPLQQDIRMFNFKHVRTLFDTLAQGPQLCTRREKRTCNRLLTTQHYACRSKDKKWRGYERHGSLVLSS
jgi:hypothetical protein